jgi:hypothetical protein
LSLISNDAAYNGVEGDRHKVWVPLIVKLKTIVGNETRITMGSLFGAIFVKCNELCGIFNRRTVACSKRHHYPVIPTSLSTTVLRPATHKLTA